MEHQAKDTQADTVITDQVLDILIQELVNQAAQITGVVVVVEPDQKATADFLMVPMPAAVEVLPAQLLAQA
jgi:hypothetical protein